MPKKKARKRQRRRSLMVKTTSRRRSTRKKGMLADLVSPAAARGGFKAAMNGAAGGVAAALLRRITAGKLPPFWDIAAPFVGGFVVAAYFKMPNVGAGMAAVGANQFMKDLGLGENDNMYLQDHNFAQDVKQLPPALDSYGRPMAENDMYLQDDEMYLQDDQYQVGYAPAFGSPTTIEDVT